MAASRLRPVTARWIALGMLASATVWVRFEERVVPADSLALENLPQQVGQWRCATQEFNNSYWPETKTINRTYRGADGTIADDARGLPPSCDCPVGRT